MPFFSFPTSLFRFFRPAILPRDLLLPTRQARPLSGLAPCFEEEDFDNSHNATPSSPHPSSPSPPFDPLTLAPTMPFTSALAPTTPTLPPTPQAQKQAQPPPLSLNTRPPASSSGGIISMPMVSPLTPLTPFFTQGTLPTRPFSPAHDSVFIRDFESALASSVEETAELEGRVAASRLQWRGQVEREVGGVASPHVEWAVEAEAWAEAWAEARRGWWVGEEDEGRNKRYRGWEQRTIFVHEGEDEERGSLEDISMLNLPEPMYPQYQQPRWRDRDVVRANAESAEELFDSRAAVKGAVFGESISPLQLPSTESSFDILRHTTASRTENQTMYDAPTIIDHDIPAGAGLGFARPQYADGVGKGPAQLDDDIPTLTNIGLQQALIPPPLPPRAPNHRLLPNPSEQSPSRPERNDLPSPPHPLEENISPPAWWEDLPKSPTRRIRRTKAPARIDTSRRPQSPPKPVWAEHFTASPEPYNSSEASPTSCWSISSESDMDMDMDTDSDSPWNPPGLHFPRSGSSHLTGPFSPSSTATPGAWSPPGHLFRPANQYTLTPGPYSGNIIEVPRTELRAVNITPPPPPTPPPPAPQPKPTARPKTAGKGASRKRQRPSSSSPSSSGFDVQAPPPPQLALCAGGCGHAVLQPQSPPCGNVKRRLIVCSDCDTGGKEEVKKKTKNAPSRVPVKRQRRAPRASAKGKGQCVIL